MKTPRLLPFFVLSLSIASLPSAFAEVKLPGVFTDHAVLQRGIAVPVWGTAEPGEKVTITFAGQTQTTKAGPDGKWKVSLKPLKEAESLELVAKGKNTITLKDVAVGEVWVASGQSNMAYRLSGDANSKAAIEAAADPQLRFLTVNTRGSAVPLSDVPSKWVVAEQGSAGGFSAVAYYFARDLRKALKVPVGILHSSVGGTPAQAWTSRAGLDSEPELAKAYPDNLEAAKKAYPAALEKFKQDEPKLLEAWNAAVEKAKADGKPAPRKPAPPADPATASGRPTNLYNGMIAPLQPYGIRGAIWYQGEANSGQGAQYRTLFPAMIADWRKAWGEGEFPFFFVQIAPHQGMSPEIREAQLLTVTKSPNTGMAVITDFGEATDIHPKHKEPVGSRLALIALAKTYDQKIEYSGPEFESMKVDGDKAVLKFKHAAGLMAKDGELKGFTVAGEDKKFVPAKATIKGDAVSVSGEGVTKPVAVRYGWTNIPDVNLYNGAGLPASPFRTDVEK